jgi:hypothetical protein
MSVVSRWSLTIAVTVVSSLSVVQAATIHPVPIQERARGAERVVVATITDVSPRYERNRYGDELIVSHAHLKVEQAIKGRPDDVTVAVEGGQVGDITLRVSDLPTVATGDRAVFFLTPGPSGEFTPHLRGQGILKLDSTDHVRGTSLTLDEIRRLAAGK